MCGSEQSSRLAVRPKEKRVVTALPFAASTQKARANKGSEFAGSWTKKAVC